MASATLPDAVLGEQHSVTGRQRTFGSDQSKTSPLPGSAPSIMMASAPKSATRERAGWPAANALITGIRTGLDGLLGGFVAVELGNARPARWTISTTRSGSSLRKIPTVIVSGGRRRTMSRPGRRQSGASTRTNSARCVGSHSDGRRPSSSLVTPQIFTNMAPTRPLGWSDHLCVRRVREGDGSPRRSPRSRGFRRREVRDAGLGKRYGIAAVPHAGLCGAHHACRHLWGHADRSLLVDFEGH